MKTLKRPLELRLQSKYSRETLALFPERKRNKYHLAAQASAIQHPISHIIARRRVQFILLCPPFPIVSTRTIRRANPRSANQHSPDGAQRWIPPAFSPTSGQAYSCSHTMATGCVCPMRCTTARRVKWRVSDNWRLVGGVRLGTIVKMALRKTGRLGFHGVMRCGGWGNNSNRAYLREMTVSYFYVRVQVSQWFGASNALINIVTHYHCQ